MIYEENTKLLVGKSIPLPKKLRETMKFSFSTEFKSYEDTLYTLWSDLDHERKGLRSTVKQLSDASVAHSPIGHDTMGGDGKPWGTDEDDVDFYEGEFPEEFFDSDVEAKSDASKTHRRVG